MCQLGQFLADLLGRPSCVAVWRFLVIGPDHHWSRLSQSITDDNDCRVYVGNLCVVAIDHEYPRLLLFVSDLR